MRSWFEDPDHTELLASPSWSFCEARLQAFEHAWTQGKAPAIADYLIARGSARQALLLELVHVDLEFRLKAGEIARVERYFEAFPELRHDHSAAQDLIEAEYALRRRAGAVSVDEYCVRFPDHREHLTQRLAGVQAARDTPAARAASAESIPWPHVPGYEILHEVGRGGMGVVYKARQPALGRHVGLKFLPPDVAGDPQRLERFVREARTASALNHPHICTIHALSEHEGRPFIVMEFIEGETLQALLGRRPSLEQCARWIGQAARALAAAHAAGVVHRDIKPENLMVRGDGYVKVLDFGLARRLPTLVGASVDAGQDTDPGTLLGTVAYMSPEQARGEPADSASDVFSLGIVLYQLATGQHPFQADSALAMLYGTTTRVPAPPSRLNPEVPAALEGLILAMLNKEPRIRPSAGEIERSLEALTAARSRPAVPAPRVIVHRDTERAALRAAFEQASAGRGRLIAVAGEPGIGKTTLVEDFLETPGVAARDTLVGWGRCSERLGGAEAYVPVIDALEELVRGDSSGAAGRLLKLVAPSWHAQVALSAPGTTPQNAAEAARASSQQALLREFRNFLVELARRGPVVLFFDDVHWADVSTVDLLAYLGRHCQAMRVLVVVTFRPTELLLGPHPFYKVKLDLETVGGCTELSLGFLDCQHIDRYLALAFPSHAFPADFASLIHARTEGNPLFVVDLLRYLRERGAIAKEGGESGRWALARALPGLADELPGSVRSMIQRKLERLGDADRRLLATASVYGHEFDSASVAAALALDAVDVDDRLQALDRVHGLVCLVREVEFPDRTLTLRYAFVHVLYQQALYVDMPPTRRAAAAAALARAVESHHGDGNLEAAAALACLYEEGRDFERAARQFCLAAQNAARVFAHREAVVLARRGLQLLDGLPDTSERAALELPLQTMLGLQLQMTEGFAAPDAKPAYNRARELCRQLPGPAPLFPVVWGLWLVSKVRSELGRAQELANELEELSRRQEDPALALQAQQALAMTAFCRGEPTAALQNAEKASALYDPQRHIMHSYLFGQDPRIICQAFGAVTLWLLGCPDHASRQSEAVIEASRGLSPSSQVVALHFGAMLHQLGGDSPRTLRLAEASATIAAEHGFSFWLAGANVLAGWALAADGDLEIGADRLRRGLLDWLATDSVTYYTYYLGLLAEVLARQGQVKEALRLLAEALELAKSTGEGLYESELYRLRGDVFALNARRPSAGGGSDPDAEKDFRRALAVARRQEAKSFELRAAVSLTRLLRDRGDRAEGQALLREVFDRFTEGWENPDLRQARALLAELAATSSKS
jgi:predicted ATPase/tRNA A-37 threonylcarbamoyl transferase component Bud32